MLINKIVRDHVTYSTSIGTSFQPCAHMYMIAYGQPGRFCLSEKYLRSLEAPLVQNSTWRGKNNASLYLSSLLTVPNPKPNPLIRACAVDQYPDLGGSRIIPMISLLMLDSIRYVQVHIPRSTMVILERCNRTVYSQDT